MVDVMLSIESSVWDGTNQIVIDSVDSVLRLKAVWELGACLILGKLCFEMNTHRNHSLDLEFSFLIRRDVNSIGFRFSTELVIVSFSRKSSCRFSPLLSLKF